MTHGERLEAGLCTRGGCKSAPLDDCNLCEPHRVEERARQAKMRARWKRKARRLGLCRYCPITKAAKLAPGQGMCLACKVRRRKVRTTLQHNDARERAAAMTRRHADGRTRYHGQGKRGQQPHGQLDRQDLTDATRRLVAAQQALAYLDTDSAKLLPRIQLRGARDAALAEIALARRTLDDVLERGHYKVAVTVEIDEDDEGQRRQERTNRPVVVSPRKG